MSINDKVDTPTLAQYRDEHGVGSVIGCPKCGCLISVEQLGVTVSAVDPSIEWRKAITLAFDGIAPAGPQDVYRCIKEHERRLLRDPEHYGYSSTTSASKDTTGLDENDEPLRLMCIDYRGAHPAHAEDAFQRIVAWVRAQSKSE